MPPLRAALGYNDVIAQPIGNDKADLRDGERPQIPVVYRGTRGLESDRRPLHKINVGSEGSGGDARPGPSCGNARAGPGAKEVVAGASTPAAVAAGDGCELLFQSRHAGDEVQDRAPGAGEAVLQKSDS